MSPRINNTFDDATNDWIREHADDLKVIEDARHLKANPIEEPPDEDNPVVSVDPACTACGRPIFEEFVDAKRPEYCTRKDCQKKRHKFELQQEAIASGELDLISCVDDEEDEGEDPFEDSDAVTDAEELPDKFFKEEQTQPDGDLKSSSDDEEDEEDEDEEDEDVDETLVLEDDELSEERDETEEDDDDSEEDESPEGASTEKIKVHGVVPTASDLGDDTPKILSVRRQLGLPEAKTDHALNNDLLDKTYLKDNRRCKIHKVYLCGECRLLSPDPTQPFIADSRSTSYHASTTAEARRRKVQETEDEVYGRVRPPEPEYEIETKDELILLAREAARIEKENLEKAEMAKRKIVKKPRVRAPKPKETPNLRRQYKFTTRQVAEVLDIPLFNKPFRVPDRSLLHDADPNTKTIFRTWYTQIAKNADERGVRIWEGRRYGDARYENVLDKQEKTEFEIVGGKPTVVSAGYVPPVGQMIDGVFVCMDELPPSTPPPASKTVAEVLPGGTRKIHTVKQLATPSKIARRAGARFPVQKSPSSWGELINALPYRWEVMITPEEKDFYKDLAAGNLTTRELDKKHGERTKEDTLLLENRIIRHAFVLRLPQLLPPLAELYRDFELDLDEDWKRDITMISKTGGGYIGGRVHAGKLNRYGKTMGLNSFRTAPAREGGGGPSEADNGAPDHDSYGEDDAA